MSKIVWSPVPYASPAGELIPHLSSRARTQMIDMVFEEIGGFQAMADWARTERTEFYRIYARGAVRSTNMEVTNNVTPESLMDELDRRMKIIDGEVVSSEVMDDDRDT